MTEQTLLCGECIKRMPYWANGVATCPHCGAIHDYSDNVDPHCCSFNARLYSRNQLSELNEIWAGIAQNYKI